MSEEHFRKLLMNHDWSYQYSNDPTEYRKGRDEAEAIRGIVRANPELEPVYYEFLEKHYA